MKKSNHRGQGDGDFSHTPFAKLKRFKPAKDQASPSKTKKPRPETGEDDAELFLRAASGARPISPAPGDQPVSARKQEIPPRAADDRDQKLFLDAMTRIGAKIAPPKSEPDVDETQLQSSSSRIKQLRRGAIRISAELDLHGSLRDEALVKLEQFITRSYQHGQKAVLVITGKGINSPEGPVLQGAVAGWLSAKGKGMVAEFTPAPRGKGGSGAYVVFLKNR